ncbi:hypothetical protein CapIbe_018070 [Capra ibex]
MTSLAPPSGAFTQGRLPGDLSHLRPLPSPSALRYWKSRGKWNSRIRNAQAEERDGSLLRWSSARGFLPSASWLQFQPRLRNTPTPASPEFCSAALGRDVTTLLPNSVVFKSQRKNRSPTNSYPAPDVQRELMELSLAPLLHNQQSDVISRAGCSAPTPLCFLVNSLKLGSAHLKRS